MEIKIDDSLFQGVIEDAVREAIKDQLKSLVRENINATVESRVKLSTMVLNNIKSIYNQFCFDGAKDISYRTTAEIKQIFEGCFFEDIMPHLEEKILEDKDEIVEAIIKNAKDTFFDFDRLLSYEFIDHYKKHSMQFNKLMVKMTNLLDEYIEDDKIDEVAINLMKNYS